MNNFEVAVIALATLLGPVLAVQAQKWLERASERRRARRAIFDALMANRATRMNDEFVRALNRIDLEFGAKRVGGAKDRAVIEAWRSLFGEYSVRLVNPTDDAARAWNQRIEDRLVTLLAAMSKAVGYDFTEEQLRRGMYYPQGRVELENTQMAVLAGVRNLIEGRSALPIKAVDDESGAAEK